MAVPYMGKKPISLTKIIVGLGIIAGGTLLAGQIRDSPKPHQPVSDQAVEIINSPNLSDEIYREMFLASRAYIEKNPAILDSLGIYARQYLDKQYGSQNTLEGIRDYFIEKFWTTSRE